MGTKSRLFLILWVAGMLGVLSFLLVDLEALFAQFSPEVVGQLPPVTWKLKLLGLVQPAVLLSLAVLAGVSLAGRIGLSAPFAEALAAGDQPGPALKSQLKPGLIGGLLGGAVIVLNWLLWKPFLPAEFVARSGAINELLPPLTRFLYGGFTEELLLRWGLMTLLVWLAWRVTQSRQEGPRSLYFAGAIAISSIVFGLGHLPFAYALAHSTSAALMLYVVVVNTLFGLIAGYLYWKKGLESAMLAHMLAHVVILSAILLGA